MSKQQQDPFFCEPQQQPDIIPLLQQHQPLPSKPLLQSQKTPTLKMLQHQRQKQFYLYRPFKLDKLPQSQQQQPQKQVPSTPYYEAPFTQFYAKEQVVYLRHQNRNFNKYKNREYYAGQFANINVFNQNSLCNSWEISDILNQYYQIEPVNLEKNKKDQHVLQFDSKFQSGNLFAALKISQYEYDLVMQNDTNSIGSNQWFYFSVQGLKPNKQYTFAVINFTKTDSLFNHGMKPVVYSLAENNYFHIQSGWKRAGSQVSYRKGKLPRQYSWRMYYRLSFKISTSYNKDKLWIAHSYPYSMEKLNKFITEKKRQAKQFVSVVQVGKTISKRTIEGIVINYPVNKRRDNRKAIVFMARQHPGQTQGSYVCQGVVQKLLSKTKQAQYLIKNFVAYVIPMINPDGVVFGHYRTNLAGKDLNRKWNATQRDNNCPQVIAIKAFLNQLHKTREIKFILDLHGHSRKLNSFFYGNPYQQCPQAVRIFPFICSKLHPGIQYFDCTFATEQCKRKAARVYLNYILKLPFVYTFQSSFYAFEKQGNIIEFTPKNYRQLGSTLITALSYQLQHDVKYQESVEFNIKRNNKEYMGSTFVKYLLELKNNKVLVSLGNQEESGSDSKPQQGQINNEDIEYERLNKMDTPLVIKDQKNNSKKIPRKTASQLRDHHRPTRNLRYMQISKINSFVPGQQGLCLQPARKKEVESTPKLKKYLVTTQCQTTDFTVDDEPHQFTQGELQNANLSTSFITENMSERKSSSLVKNLNNKNNIIFRIEYMTNTSDHQIGSKQKKNIIKNALSQTLLTFPSQSKKLKEKKAELKTQTLQSDKEEQSSWWIKSTQMKLDNPFNGLMLRKDQTFYFNGMVQKFLKKKQSSYSDMGPVNRSNLDKSFSIKKKDNGKK